MQIKNNTTIDFDWVAFDAEDLQARRVPNPILQKKYGVKIWRHDSGAEEMYLRYEKSVAGGIKEPRIGEYHTITSIVSINDTEMVVTLSGMIDAVIQLEKEKPYFKTIGMNLESFVDWMKNTEGAFSGFIGAEGKKVVIETIKPYTIASLSKGHFQSIRSEFFHQIENPTSAYTAKIVSRNGGGFLVNVAGIEGFLPGSLAAANIVRDFDSLINKEIYVMVEDYLKDAGTFVFSHKKYLSHVLPSKIENLSLEERYSGMVTGSAKFGIFVEFNEIFTGLIHTSKMTSEMRDDFRKGQYSAGDTVYFWIKEIAPDKKIILTDEDPSIRMRELEEFKEKHLGVITGGEVVSIQPFGTLVKLQKDIVGLISKKEIKVKKKNYAVGDHVMVSVERVQNDRIFLTIPNEE